MRFERHGTVLGKMRIGLAANPITITEITYYDHRTEHTAEIIKLEEWQEIQFLEFLNRSPGNNVLSCYSMAKDMYFEFLDENGKLGWKKLKEFEGKYVHLEGAEKIYHIPDHMELDK